LDKFKYREFSVNSTEWLERLEDDCFYTFNVEIFF